MPPRLSLALLPEIFAVCRLEPESPVPGWAEEPGELVSISRTPNELSIVCEEVRVPPDVRAERGWRCLRVGGPLDFSLVGILSAIARPLADAGLSLFALSTYDTDYILVRESDLPKVRQALTGAGHTLASL